MPPKRRHDGKGLKGEGKWRQSDGNGKHSYMLRETVKPPSYLIEVHGYPPQRCVPDCDVERKYQTEYPDSPPVGSFDLFRFDCSGIWFRVKNE